MNFTELIHSMHAECQNLRLLYVEDDRTLLSNTYEMLKPFFHAIEVAYDGAEGLDKYQESSFDIVMTDIIMPKLDGKELSRRIRQIDPDQPIIVMSAHEEAEHFMDLIQIGISKFVQKPPSLDQLLGSIIPTARNVNNAKKVAFFNSQIQQNLAESKELLRNIIDTVPVRIFWKDTESKYLGCNALFARDAGAANQTDLIGKNDFEMPWKQEAQRYVDDDREVMETGKGKFDIEETQIRSDGTMIWLSTSKVPLKNEKSEIVGVLGSYVDITEHKKSKEALSYQAHHDALTGLPNRLLYLDRLRQAIKKIELNHQKIAVVFIDLDRFKEINDSLGHEIGDHIVKMAAERLKEVLREVDTLARFGGDEFAILIESFEDEDSVGLLMEKIVKSMEKPFDIDAHRLYLTLSAGISIYPDDTVDPDMLIRNADTAMYRAKELGRNTYRFYAQEMTEKTYATMMMSKNIRQALENGEFSVYYQPQIDVSKNKVVGMEALVRWKSADGFISPGVFIPIAEELGLIEKIGETVLEEAARQIAKWYSMGLNPGRVSINLSPLELQRENFVESIKARVDDCGCRPEWVEFEITEGYTMKHPEEAISILQSLNDSGFRLSIDDFGTGYSSLSYLKKLPVHKLKIDQSFVRDIPENKNDAAIVLSIIFLSKTMKFDVIAEGVETLEQQAYLVSKGCRKIQGYLHGRPMPPSEMEAFLKTMGK